MGSGLVYIIIVGMWISYFLPRWITNHEEVSGKSMERFASAMKRVGATTGNLSIDLHELHSRKESQLISRRILFFAISGATLLVALFILVGFVSPVIVTIPISSFALYLVHARHQIQTLEEEIELAQSATQMESERSRQGYAELIARSKRAARQLSTLDDEHWTPLTERKDRSESEISGITILPKGSAQERSTWQPTEVPAPTYVQSAKAAPRRRTIDLTIPGAWSEATELASGNKFTNTRDEVFDQELAEEIEEQLRRNRAVNE